MPAPAPQFIPQAFAQNAAGPNRNVIPDTTLSLQRASWNLGYPPQTMQPVVAGGKPMLGPDMNGVLYMMSSHAYYAQSGEPYHYNADVVVAIAGYKIGTLLGSTDGTTLWYNIVADNASDPDAGGAGWVALFSYGMAAVAGLIGGLRTLLFNEYAKPVIVLTGALVANQQIVLPLQLKRWLIVNATSGAFSVTVKTAAGTGVIVPQAGFAAPVEVYGDGTNIYNVVAPVNLPIDQNPTALTIVQRTNAGYVLATYFNQSSALEAFTMSAVFAQQGADGYLRKISLANFLLQALANAALTGVPTAPTAAPGTNTTQIASTAFVQAAAAAQSLGVGQAWTNQTGARLVNITYTNTFGRAIEVMVSLNVNQGGNASVLVNGLTIMSIGNGSSAANELPVSFVVPDGHTYRVNCNSAASRWAELR